MTLDVRNLGKRFGSECVFRDVTFHAGSSEITFLYGHSGCGKSTILRILAGLDSDHDGTATIDGYAVQGPSRRVGMTVQQDLSFPWMTVQGNIEFGAKYAHRDGAAPSSSANVQNIARLVGLDEPQLRKYPSALSGGMKQRMALARALSAQPKLLLLDEPFSALDYEARQTLQDVVLNVRNTLGTSFVCVSHDPEEVLYMADQVVLLGGEPTTVVELRRPVLTNRIDGRCKYSADFQEEKRKLRELVGSTVLTTSGDSR